MLAAPSMADASEKNSDHAVVFISVHKTVQVYHTVQTCSCGKCSKFLAFNIPSTA